MYLFILNYFRLHLDSLESPGRHHRKHIFLEAADTVWINSASALNKENTTLLSPCTAISSYFHLTASAKADKI